VRLELLDIEQLEPVVGEHALGGQAREVLEVLVVDRVELVVLDEPQQVRHLDRHHAVVGQQDLEAGDEVVEVRHVRHHVVGGDQVGALALGDEVAGRLAPEEADERLDSELLCHLGDVGGRLDAQRRDAALDDVPQQVAVVARDLHDQAVGAEAEALDRHLDVAARVLDPRVGVRREVRVLGEDVVGGDERLELHQQAALADLRVERVERLHRVDALGWHVALAQRRHAEVDEGVAQRGCAEAARGQALGGGCGRSGRVGLRCRHV
jgi:hypothetical protein